MDTFGDLIPGSLPPELTDDEGRYLPPGGGAPVPCRPEPHPIVQTLAQEEAWDEFDNNLLVHLHRTGYETLHRYSREDQKEYNLTLATPCGTTYLLQMWSRASDHLRFPGRNSEIPWEHRWSVAYPDRCPELEEYWRLFQMGADPESLALRQPHTALVIGEL